jgi:hypothetical protein
MRIIFFGKALSCRLSFSYCLIERWFRSIWWWSSVMWMLRMGKFWWRYENLVLLRQKLPTRVFSIDDWHNLAHSTPRAEQLINNKFAVRHHSSKHVWRHFTFLSANTIKYRWQLDDMIVYAGSLLRWQTIYCSIICRVYLPFNEQRGATQAADGCDK